MIDKSVLRRLRTQLGLSPNMTQGDIKLAEIFYNNGRNDERTRCIKICEERARYFKSKSGEMGLNGLDDSTTREIEMWKDKQSGAHECKLFITNEEIS